MVFQAHTKRMKDSIADLRNKWKLFYFGLKDSERKNIVIYFKDERKVLNDFNYIPRSLSVIQVEVMNKTKLAKKMLKHLSEIGLI